MLESIELHGAIPPEDLIRQAMLPFGFRTLTERVREPIEGAMTALV